MPTVTLSDATFAELKSLAEPFVDTPESLTASLIHAEVVRRGGSPSENAPSPSADGGFLQLNPDRHESLAFTRVLSATVDSREIHRPKWNSVMNHVHVLGLRRLGSFDALRHATHAQLRRGCYEEEGYKCLHEVDISIQGVDSNGAWDHSLAVARAARIPIRITFEWRDRDDAAHPGRRGVLEWNPATS